MERSVPGRVPRQPAAGGRSGGDGAALGRGGDLPETTVPGHTPASHAKAQQFSALVLRQGANGQSRVTGRRFP